MTPEHVHDELIKLREELANHRLSQLKNQSELLTRFALCAMSLLWGLVLGLYLSTCSGHFK